MSKLFTLLLCALCSVLVSGAPELKQSSKVKVQVLYECMCPGCMQEMTQQITPVYHKLADYIDMHLYPFGNAIIINQNGKNIDVICLRGPNECYGNKIHACAIDILKDASVYMDFIACTMTNMTNDQEATQCAQKFKIDVNPILKCAKSDRGLQLLIETGMESGKIQYNHVPYVVLNDQPMDISNSLKTEICKLLSPPPPPCSS